MGSLGTALSRLIASVFYIGYIPVAPGTFGSIAAMAFVWLLRPETPLLLVTWAVSVILGGWSSHEAEKASGDLDPGHIVIDEFAGYVTAVLFLPLSPGIMLAALVLFRLLDIFKPHPIRTIERRVRGGAGIMLDDLAAGAIANLLLQAWRLI